MVTNPLKPVGKPTETSWKILLNFNWFPTSFNHNQLKTIWKTSYNLAQLQNNTVETNWKTVEIQRNLNRFHSVFQLESMGM